VISMMHPQRFEKVSEFSTPMEDSFDLAVCIAGEEYARSDLSPSNTEDFEISCAGSLFSCSAVLQNIKAKMFFIST
jgi:hypothetical protein